MPRILAGLPLICVFGFLLLSGCEQDASKSPSADGPAVIYVENDDPEMQAAISKARETVDEFIAALDDPQASGTGFSVKLLVEDGEHGEHMWVLPVRYEEGRFYGRVNNNPDRVTTVKIGDEVDVAASEITDWMYVEDGKLHGGYSIRLLRERMPADERKAFDAQVPFTIDG